MPQPFPTCVGVFKVITLIGSNQHNYFENANACSERTLKTTVATHLLFLSTDLNHQRRQGIQVRKWCIISFLSFQFIYDNLSCKIFDAVLKAINNRFVFNWTLVNYISTNSLFYYYYLLLLSLSHLLWLFKWSVQHVCTIDWISWYNV